ncbi:hydroxypyruvate isomerase family protein (plasmid) [Peteryoungia desertarenae]|uniref:Hydroxypyruvate isomerase family protein n=1 Tax=Peteryoungia desertarenae TaxID=1813451 RepID=A0ABX6QTK1_9HYPH|nr:2-oxo-tetronate isomerase [Peteryoungia desertarenae]QLF71535.1 hydroxypyruvate isomerase family protein [Peteryoungia desertarenae]
MPKFAANLTMMFNDVPFLHRFEAAASCGFSAVEYLFPYEHPPEVIADQLLHSHLSQALFNMPPGDWHLGERGLAALPERKRDFRDSLDKALSYAQVIGSPLLHMMAGIAPSNDRSAIDTYRENLKLAAERTGEYGIGLTIEPINGRDMPGYFLQNFEQAAEFIEAVGAAHVKLQFDIYHRQILHGDVIMGLRQYAHLIGHIQIASVPDRNEPFTGELNDRLILEEIDAIGYKGYVGCEYRPCRGTQEGLTWLTELP